MAKLILLHGALAGRRQFNPLLPLLKPELQATAIDFAGHGDYALGNRFFSLEQFCDDILEAAGPEPADLFGYSMGGYVAMYTALKYPERVKRVLTLSTKYRWDATLAATEAAKLDPAMLEQKAPDFVKGLQEQHPATDWRALLLNTATFLTDLGQHDYLAPGHLSGITIPVCTAVGDRDKLVTLDETVATYKAVSNGQLAVLPGTPHLFEKMEMERVAGLVNSFFRS